MEEQRELFLFDTVLGGMWRYDSASFHFGAGNYTAKESKAKRQIYLVPWRGMTHAWESRGALPFHPVFGEMQGNGYS